MITIEALPAFINRSGYSGQALAEAVIRILERLKREQIPIHVHTAIEQLVINIDVEYPVPTVDVEVGVEVEQILVELDGNQRFDCRFDDIPADTEELDTCAMLLSYPGVSVEIEQGDPPVSGITVEIELDPLEDPSFDFTIINGVYREVLVTGSSFFDDIPADEQDTDLASTTIEPEVVITVTVG